MHPDLRRRARTDGTAHGIALLNSNGMDVTLTQTRVTWHVTGGVIDLYFLMGPSPMDVLDQLTQIIGRPMMPPFWSLGLMNSKCAHSAPGHYGRLLSLFLLVSLTVRRTARSQPARAAGLPCGRAGGPPARPVAPRGSVAAVCARQAGSGAAAMRASGARVAGQRRARDSRI
jgi:hypothetical protein